MFINSLKCPSISDSSFPAVLVTLHRHSPIVNLTLGVAIGSQIRFMQPPPGLVNSCDVRRVMAGVCRGRIAGTPSDTRDQRGKSDCRESSFLFGASPSLNTRSHFAG